MTMRGRPIGSPETGVVRRLMIPYCEVWEVDHHAGAARFSRGRGLAARTDGRRRSVGGIGQDHGFCNVSPRLDRGVRSQRYVRGWVAWLCAGAEVQDAGARRRAWGVAAVDRRRREVPSFRAYSASSALSCATRRPNSHRCVRIFSISRRIFAGEQ